MRRACSLLARPLLSAALLLTSTAAAAQVTAIRVGRLLDAEAGMFATATRETQFANRAAFRAGAWSR